MPQTIRAETTYQARLLNNPSDPKNSSWELLIDEEEYVDSDVTPEELAVQGSTYQECLTNAIKFLREQEYQEEIGALVIAQLEVTYLIPSREEIHATNH